MFLKKIFKKFLKSLIMFLEKYLIDYSSKNIYIANIVLKNTFKENIFTKNTLC